ncbi:hypothetical protein [Nitrosopumilus ureiphilus]|uniref:Uncharacterized protein n=1 Tax=Nitrosopumilus ureiphilus TaxID=1470067 RepID=A0A7D5RD17_9ARCH|nr:hypothetical protein [Nitrosopumilus ureiphilus]QLH06321.1 hypothetical protein C5F50_03950 [Nitrosopumilus ureiphilus]
MTMLLAYDPILEKLQKHFETHGIKAAVSEERYDFEGDFLDSYLLETKGGIGNAGTLKLDNSSIDYVHVLKKQEYVKCDYAAGGHVGMGMHKHSWWMMRFFLAFPEPINLGPFNIGTITTVKKGLFHSEVESFMWNGYQKLTTLPPGLIRDNVVEQLDRDQRLQQLMTKCLLKERTILISRYSPPKESTRLKSNSKILITSKWKIQKDLFVDKNTLDMYERMAEIVKQTINNLKYHLL